MNTAAALLRGVPEPLVCPERFESEGSEAGKVGRGLGE